MKSIIFAVPNSGSTTLMNVINRYSNKKCIQVMDYNFFRTYNGKKKIFNLLFKLKLKSFALELSNQLIFLVINKLKLVSNKIRNTNPANDYKFLRQYHSDICDVELKLFREFKNFLELNKDVVLKQHFPPTEFNRIYFKEFKKIILTRETDGIMKKYKTRSYFYENFKKGLEEDVNKWKENWQKENNILVIKFEDLIKQPLLELKKIENFTDIKFKIDENFELPHLNKT
jgi:hypothetical protein